jgi:hypothetical protein
MPRECPDTPDETKSISRAKRRRAGAVFALLTASSMRYLLCLVAAAALSFPSLARAENDDGLELMVRPAYGSAGGGSPVVYAPQGGTLATSAGSVYSGTASPYGGGFVGDAWLGYRFSRFASIGVSGGFRSSSASAVNDGTTNLARSAWGAGPYVRGYAPTLFGFEGWLSVGAEYMHDEQTYDGTVSNVPVAFSLVHHGVAVPIGVGIDYRFLNVLGIGPSFFYAPVFAVAGCAGAQPQVAGYVGTNYCSNDSGPKITAANGYGVWSVGLDVRLTVF